MEIDIELCRSLDERIKKSSYNECMTIDGSIHYTIYEHIKSGLKIAEISEAVGMNKSTAYDCIKRLGISKYGPGLKLCGKRSGNNRTFPKRKFVYLKSNCETCGILIYHHRTQCNYCRGKNGINRSITENS